MPSMTESTEPLTELILTSQQMEVLRGAAVDKGKGPYIPSPKKNTTPPTESKGVVINALAAPAPSISGEEKEPIIDIIPPPTRGRAER